MTIPTDWFVSDQQIRDLFASLRGPARAAAIDAVNAAAQAAQAQIPSLAASMRAELTTALQVIRDQINGVIDEQVAHAIRLVALAQPQLRQQVNELAQSAGVTASDAAIDNLNRRTTSNVPYVVAAGVAIAVAVAATALYLAERANAREAEAARIARARRQVSP